MKDAQVAYLGFTTKGAARVYQLSARQADGEVREFALAIPIEAFTAGRVRFQDAPDICFAKLQRVLAAVGEPPLASEIGISNADLEEYRVAHTARHPQRRVLGR